MEGAVEVRVVVIERQFSLPVPEPVAVGVDELLATAAVPPQCD
jgi:hypothetical protein